MAFHPKQIPEFLQSRLGILLIVFLVGGFALAFYSFGNRQVIEQKKQQSQAIDKISQATANATPSTVVDPNSNEATDVDTDQTQRVYDRPNVELPSLPPPPPPVSNPSGSGLSHFLPGHSQPPPQQIPPLRVASYGGGNNNNDQNANVTAPPPPVTQPPPKEGPPGEFDGDFAPFGRLLKCELVNTIDSSDAQTPIIAFVTDDLWWNGKLIIPAGTEVHGTTAGGSGDQDTSVAAPGGKTATPQNPSSGGTLRDRVTTGTDWILVTPPYDEAPNGAELLLSGLALDRENLTNDDNGSWAITDGSYGIKGKIIDDLSNERILQFLGTFVSAGLPVLESQNVYSSSVSTSGPGTTGTSSQFYTSPKATVPNAIEQGLSAAVQEQIQNITEEIKRTGHYIRVPAGRQFYLYVTQTIDPTEAHIGANFRTHTVPGAIKKFSSPNVYKSFLQSLGKPASSIVPPSQVVSEQNDEQTQILEQQQALNAQKEQQEAQLQSLVSKQDLFMRNLSQSQRQSAAASDSMAPSNPNNQ